MTDLSSVYVLGLGLIGGSLVRATAPGRKVVGWSPSEGTRLAAIADGYSVLDSLDQTLAAAQRDDALVVLAAPVTAFPDLLKRVDEHAPTVRLTDVASVKAAVTEQVEEFAPQARYIGSHPMAGTQHSGWAAGSSDLFRGAAWVTSLTEDSATEVWADVAELALGVGSRVVPADPAAHDDAVARISHVPHLLALALAQAGAEGGRLSLSLAASSFGDGTRVAATRPELIRAMCETNRSALVGAIDEVLGLLGVARGSLASTGSLAKITAAGHQGRLDFENRQAELQPVTLSGDDMIEQLLAVGASGGYVTGLTRTAGGLTVQTQCPDED